MGLIHLIQATPEIVRRRAALPRGTLVEAWLDLTQPEVAWVGQEAKRLLDSVGSPIPPKCSIDGELVRIYYGPRLRDVGSLPSEESLRARALSAHGIAVAWVTIDARGERTTPESGSASEATFYLRRPRGDTVHVWQLFRTKREAVGFMKAQFGDDPEARKWATDLPVDDFTSLMSRITSEPGESDPPR